MNFAFYIARRYVLSLSRQNAINIITGIASVGIIAGTLSLFVVLSVFSGLKEFSLSFSNSFDPDVKLFPKTGKYFDATPQQLQKLQAINGVQAQSAVIEERVLFLFDDKEMVAWLKGVDSRYTQVNPIHKSMFNGQWLAPDTFQAVMGYGVAQHLSAGLFDYQNALKVYVPKPGKGAIENPEQAFNREALLPVGIYTVNEDLDSKYVFADLGLVQELLQYPQGRVSSVEIKLKKGADEAQVISEAAEIFDGKVNLKNRAQLNDSLYRMLNTENLAVYLIFTLVIIIALFNLIGALIMTILDKKSNLKTLRHLGARLPDLRRIFLLQGTLLTVGGGIIGLILGVVIVLLQQRYEFVMITSTLAYPVKFEVANLLIVMFTIVTLGIAASWIAASRITSKFFD